MSERIWTPFLTDQDRKSLKERPHLMWGFGERPALLLVDLYRSAFGDRPEPLLEAMKTWPGSCGLAGWNAIPHIQKVLQAAREANIPIVHITALDGTNIVRWPHAGRLPASGSQTKLSEDQARRQFDIIDEVAPIDGEAIIYKTAPSAFWGTPLVGHLNANRIDTLIVCGQSTSGCVRATVVDGRSNRYRMIVAEEGVFDRHEAPHAINLFDMHQKYADVLPVDEIVDNIMKYKK